MRKIGARAEHDVRQRAVRRARSPSARSGSRRRGGSPCRPTRGCSTRVNWPGGSLPMTRRTSCPRPAQRGGLELRVLDDAAPERPRVRHDDADLHAGAYSLASTREAARGIGRRYRTNTGGHAADAARGDPSRHAASPATLRGTSTSTRGVLGLRLVKKTVNQDDPTVYHLFYADEKGSAGADITFFEYPGATPGSAGAGMVHTFVWRVALRRRRSTSGRTGWGRGAEPSSATDGSLGFEDPEGVRPRAGSSTTRRRATHRRPPGGSGRARAAGLRRRPRVLRRPRARRRSLLEETLGFAPRGENEWEARGDHRGGIYAYDPAARGPRGPGRRHGPPRRVGVEHGRARGLAQRGRRGGLRPTPVIDRFWFRSIYFREPSGFSSRSRRSGPASRSTRIPSTSARR